MAVSKSFFGLRKGSTKSLTFSVLNGRQVTKDRVLAPRNPNTEAQRVQRVIFNTAISFYAAAKGILNHSLQGVAYGGLTQQAWMRKNLKKVRERLAYSGRLYSEKSFVPYGMSFPAANYYIMSEGTLPSVPYAFDAQGNFAVSLDGVSTDMTYADVIAALDCKAGDQLTICVISPYNKISDARFHYCRIILQPQDDAGADLDLTLPFLIEDSGIYRINQPNARNNASSPLFGFSPASEKLVVSFDGQLVSGGCVILSSRDLTTGQWLRSTQSMAVNPLRSGFTLIEAMQQSAAVISTESDKYLNNAEDGSGSTGQKYDIIVSAGDESLFSLSTNAAAKGSKVLVYPSDGYRVSELVVLDSAGEFVASEISTTGIGAFVMPDGAVTISVTIVEKSVQYTISTSANPANGGSVTGGGTFYRGQEISLLATPNSGFEFEGWSDGGSQNPRTLVVSENKTISANFREAGKLSFEIKGSDGAVIIDDETHTLPYSTFVDAGTTIVAQIDADSGFEFEGWSDGGSQNPRTFENIQQDVSVTANFGFN